MNKIHVVGMLVATIGIAIICFYSNWQVAVGVFIMMYGDNLSKV